jgi:hypothetical protein
MIQAASEGKAWARWGLAAFALVALLAPISAWRLSSWLMTPPPYQPIPRWPPVSTWNAEDIAIAEVKEREGWSGHAEVQGEGSEWWVYVFHDYDHRRTDPNARWVAVDIQDGHVSAYNSANRTQ